jgi:hypothetical protein
MFQQAHQTTARIQQPVPEQSLQTSPDASQIQQQPLLASVAVKPLLPRYEMCQDPSVEQ